jgi:hypothetical protein
MIPWAIAEIDRSRRPGRAGTLVSLNPIPPMSVLPTRPRYMAVLADKSAQQRVG